jgi:hypothetical protein
MLEKCDTNEALTATVHTNSSDKSRSLFYSFFSYSAANMMQLAWDDELAVGAQLWASQCNFNHDTDRNVCRFPVGQNLYIAGSTGTPKRNWKEAIGETQYHII